jgi:hypothetical protein
MFYASRPIPRQATRGQFEPYPLAYACLVCPRAYARFTKLSAPQMRLYRSCTAKLARCRRIFASFWKNALVTPARRLCCASCPSYAVCKLKAGHRPKIAPSIAPRARFTQNRVGIVSDESPLRSQWLATKAIYEGAARTRGLRETLCTRTVAFAMKQPG